MGVDEGSAFSQCTTIHGLDSPKFDKVVQGRGKAMGHWVADDGTNLGAGVDGLSSAHCV